MYHDTSSGDRRKDILGWLHNRARRAYQEFLMAGINAPPLLLATRHQFVLRGDGCSAASADKAREDRRNYPGHTAHFSVAAGGVCAEAFGSK